MADPTVEQAMDNAKMRAAEKAAEIFFYKKNTPFYPLGFSVTNRNPGHWDIFAEKVPGEASAWKSSHPDGSTSAKDNGRERAFCIRGGPHEVQWGGDGLFYVRDERWNPLNPHPRKSMPFRSVIAAMVWICEELMQEPSPTPEAK